MKYIFKKKRLVLVVGMFDAVGSFVAFLLKFFYRGRPAELKKSPSFLIIRLDHIGDVLYSTFAAQAAKDCYPGCRVTFLTSEISACLLKNNPYVDDVIIYNAPWFGHRTSSGGAGTSFLKLCALLKEKKFDGAFSLRGDLRECLLMFLAGIPKRVGYGITGGGFLLTDEASYTEGLHETEHMANLLSFAGIPVPSTRPSLYFSDAEKELFASKYKALGFGDSVCLIALQVDAGTSAKEWPEESMGRLASFFRDEFKEKKLVLVGQNTERGARINRKCPDCLNLTGKLDLREIFLLSQRLSVFIGHDSGPTHIAACSGVRTIYLFSGTNDWSRWKPVFSNAVTLREPVDCSPCYRQKCNVAGHPCMNRIMPETVARAVRKETAI